MRIEIEIPKEFEEHFNHDRFEDSLQRLMADAHLLAGRYEREMSEMLIKAFKESKPAYDIDKSVKELEEFLINYGIPKNSRVHQKIMGIVNRGGVSDDVCGKQCTRREI